jgi:hypothetical protein
MLTPSEEQGLAVKRLETRVRRAFETLTAAEQSQLLARIHSEARERHLFYLREGKVDIVPLFPVPLVAVPEQVAYLHSVSQTIHRALKRLPELYLKDGRVRELLRLPDAEEAWLRELWSARHLEDNPVFGRLDAVVNFTSSHWKETLKFLEPNLGGIGGLHLLPMADRVIEGTTVPALHAVDAGLQLMRNVDVRDQLMEYLLEHLEALGRPFRTLCFIEPKFAGSGPEEQVALAEYFRQHYGIRVFHADPSELREKDGEVLFGDALIDIGYRDYEVKDLLELQASGVDVSPMRTLLRENRMVSSIAAELDAKSCFEVFTTPELVQAHFSSEERQVFRRHVLWTRLLSERTTLLPDGQVGALLEYARPMRETLVLKPNRDYGGHGILLGASVEEPEWNQALDRALADREQRWVLQQVTPLPVHDFPVLADDGQVRMEPFYAVLGLVTTPLGVALLGRASQKQVVNVAQRGGIFSVLVASRPGASGGERRGPRGAHKK